MVTVTKIGKDCVGCRSCELTCPNKCITIEENEEGFLYPVVYEKDCVQCGMCLRKCPIGKPYDNERELLGTYALREKNKEFLFGSASGGASDVAVEAILGCGGYVYGAAYDENFVVQHIEVADAEGRKRIQSSKYVQSDLKDSYVRAKKRLEDGNCVLFTGTPCQIAGLYAFLGKEYESLYTLDLICHGVPSPKFFKKYLAWYGKEIGGKVIYYNFRSKEKHGWGTQYLLKIMTKAKIKTKTKTLALDKYGKHFMQGDCYRESCYRCRYASSHHPADLTVGDFWGIENCYPDFFSKFGVSTVLINSKQGQHLFELMKSNANIIPITLEEAMIKQGNLKEPTKRLRNRDEFYKEINSDMFIQKIKVGIQPKERLKAILPSGLVRAIKRTAKITEGGG